MELKTITKLLKGKKKSKCEHCFVQSHSFVISSYPGNRWSYLPTILLASLTLYQALLDSIRQVLPRYQNYWFTALGANDCEDLIWTPHLRRLGIIVTPISSWRCYKSPILSLTLCPLLEYSNQNNLGWTFRWSTNLTYKYILLEQKPSQPHLSNVLGWMWS